MSALIVLLPVALAEEFSHSYDLNGNLISDGKYYREYNGLNQLVKVRLGNTSTSPIAEEYLWHPIEERIVVKRVFYNGVLNYTVYYPTKEYVRIVNSSGTFDEVYVYQDTVLVAQIDADGNKQFIHNDHIGSTSLVTDPDGDVLEETFYSPYGEILKGGKSSRFDYEGKEYDSIVEDYDFHFRKYKPDVPIFNQPDTLIVNVYDPQSLNRYMFERGNPYKYTDPTGHQIAEFLDSVGLGPEIRYPDGVPPSDADEVQQKVNRAENSKFVTGGALGLIPILGDFIGAGYHKKTKVGETEKGIIYAHPDGSYSYEYKTKAKTVKTEEDLKCGLAGDCEQPIEGQNSENTEEQPKGTPSISSTSFQANSAKTINTGSSSSSNSYNRYSSSGGKPKVSKDGTVTLGSGGRSGSFRCYASSCSATKAYKKPSKYRRT